MNGHSAGGTTGDGGPVVAAGGGREATAPAGPSATTADSASAFRDVWTRLCDPTLPRHFRSTTWAILHGIIGVNAFIYHTQLQPGRPSPDPATRLCSNPTCLSQGVHEDISHAFLQCPAVAPAIDWLLQVWQRLSNSASTPPRTAAVLLADDVNAWPPDIRPQGGALALWTRLRVCVIGALWQVRCLRGEVTIRHESLAHRAISLAVDALTEAIKVTYANWIRETSARHGGVDVILSSRWPSSTRLGRGQPSSATLLDRGTTDSFSSSLTRISQYHSLLN